MCEADILELCMKETGDGEYFPPTYEKDGFVHCTSDPHMLVDIANAFYKSNTNLNWVCVSLWVSKLGDVRFEAPAPVGNISSDVHKKSPGIEMPHVYGPLRQGAIIHSYNMKRSDDGTFLGIENL